MLIRIDPGSPEPLFTQVTRAVRAEIASGRIAVGERLPSAREIAPKILKYVEPATCWAASNQVISLMWDLISTCAWSVKPRPSAAR